MSLSTIVLVIMCPVNIALNIAFVHYTSLGLLGSAVALCATYWLCFLLLCIFTYFSPTHDKNGTWGGLQPSLVFEARSCAIFLRLALPGILMVGTEWAAFEIVALAAGRLGEIPLAAQSVIMTTDQGMCRLRLPPSVLLKVSKSLEHTALRYRCRCLCACRQPNWRTVGVWREARGPRFSAVECDRRRCGHGYHDSGEGCEHLEIALRLRALM